MLTFRFNGCNKLQQLFAFHAFSAQHIGHFWNTSGNGSRFIKDNRLNIVSGFQRFGTLDQNAVFRAAPRSHHNGSRGGQTQSARAADNQNADSMIHRFGHRAAKSQPHHQNNQSKRHNNGNENSADLIGNALDRRFRAGRFINKGNDLRQRGIGTHAFRLHGEIPCRVHRSTGNGITRQLLNRHAFTRDSAFVHRSVARDNHAINGHRLARLHRKHVSHLHVFDGDLRFRTIIGNKKRCFRRKIHERRNGIGRFSLCACLKELSQRDKCQNHCSRLKVQIH